MCRLCLPAGGDRRKTIGMKVVALAAAVLMCAVPAFAQRSADCQSAYFAGEVPRAIVIVQSIPPPALVIGGGRQHPVGAGLQAHPNRSSAVASGTAAAPSANAGALSGIGSITTSGIGSMTASGVGHMPSLGIGSIPALATAGPATTGMGHIGAAPPAPANPGAPALPVAPPLTVAPPLLVALCR